MLFSAGLLSPYAWTYGSPQRRRSLPTLYLIWALSWRWHCQPVVLIDLTGVLFIRDALFSLVLMHAAGNVVEPVFFAIRCACTRWCCLLMIWGFIWACQDAAGR